ncbi:atrial natriuretic peptide receptor 1-like [Paramacrobiotus metropolitanus]|uniref:atrial natriuretic peptide receptor 1-like n=1 Tax=Paramacrobiotus metropolitanus TaxID=2943436 RepID=UPI002445D098|nr:atrial natriuretic peptide receptor 1-like [Paramacrobiotus metropolitanus]
MRALFLMIFLPHAIGALRVITVIVGDNPSSGIQLTGPAFDVAFADASARFGGILDNITRVTVYRPGALSCAGATDNIANVLGNMTNTIMASTEPTVLLSAGCSLEVLVFGDFAREWNLALLASMAGDAAFSNRARYATTLIMGPTDQASLALGTHHFLDFFGWRTVSLLCDRLSKNVASTGFSSIACSTIQKRLINGSGKYVVNIHDFDPADNNSSFSGILEMTKLQSRSMPVALRAMKTLIVANNLATNWTKVAQIVAKMSAVAKEVYNYTYRKGEINDLTMASYETINTFAEVYSNMLNTTMGAFDMDGRSFVKRFYNRYFEYDSRGFLINDRGIRTIDVNFWRMDNSSFTEELAWKYSVKDATLHTMSPHLAAAWPESGKIPTDVPECGFLNDKCLVPNSYLWEIGTAAGVVLGLGLIAFSILLKILSLRAIRSLADWYLYPSTFPLTPFRDTSGTIKEINLDDATKHCADHLYIYEKHQLIWAECLRTRLTETQISSKRKIVDALLEVRSLSQDNIQKLRGLYMCNEAVMLIWDFGARGILRSLIDSDRLLLSHDIRGSLCWDLIKAVQYLRKSRLGFHGSLCSLNCMVDKRFSLQLATAGTSKMHLRLFDTCQRYHSQLHKFWLAPEVLANPRLPGSHSADVFGMGVIMAEVITGKTPMDIDFKSVTKLEEKSEELQAIIKKKVQYERIAVGTIQVLPIRSLLSSMIRHHPSERPTIEQIMRSFGRTYRRANVVDSLIKRLENFTNELEQLVLARTQELWEEMIKVDELLSEIVPRSFVARLRNKTEIPPEIFESISLLFSALPQFAEFCQTSDSTDVIHLLHDVYVRFDYLLESFDVYKVETIKDSYMVASGLPIRNKSDHVSHILNLAVALMESKRDIQYPTLPEGLYLRIGVHTGSCAAGIVGHKMPRYCLFGDTVNIASRMESSGLGKDQCSFRKGKGLCETFWLTSASCSRNC